MFVFLIQQSFIFENFLLQSFRKENWFVSVSLHKNLELSVRIVKIFELTSDNFWFSQSRFSWNLNHQFITQSDFFWLWIFSDCNVQKMIVFFWHRLTFHWLLFEHRNLFSIESQLHSYHIAELEETSDCTNHVVFSTSARYRSSAILVRSVIYKIVDYIIQFNLVQLEVLLRWSKIFSKISDNIETIDIWIVISDIFFEITSLL